MTKEEMLTELLDLKCDESGQTIKVGEVVRLFDWGSKRRIIGYGSYRWDESERHFYLSPNTILNEHFGIKFWGIEDRYDLFRTSPEKLTKEEIELLEPAKP